MRNDCHEVCGLTNGGVDLVPWYRHVVFDAAEAESADSTELVQRRYVEHLVDEVCLAQLRVLLFQVGILTIDLLLALELLSQLVLVVVNFLPDGAILLEDLVLLRLFLD